MADTKDEFVHYFTEFYERANGPAVVVGVPEGDEITRVATIKRWDDGHLASIRSVLRGFRARRRPTIPITGGKYGDEGGIHYLVSQPILEPMFQPVPTFSAAPGAYFPAPSFGGGPGVGYGGGFGGGFRPALFRGGGGGRRGGC